HHEASPYGLTGGQLDQDLRNRCHQFALPLMYSDPATSSCRSASSRSTGTPRSQSTAATTSPNEHRQMCPKSPSRLPLLKLPMSIRRETRCAALAATRTTRRKPSLPSRI